LLVGWNGLIAAYTYLQLAPETNLLIIDNGKTIGGTWSKEKIYPNLYAQINTPKFEFTMWPMKHQGISEDGYIPAMTVHDYLVSFADEFGLSRRTQLNTNVIVVDRALDGKRWAITVDKGPDIICEKLIYATGPTSSTIVPKWPRESFSRPLVHSQAMGGHLPWIEKNCKRTTVIGGAKSAFDTVFMLVKAGQRVDWIMRDSPSGPLSLSAPTFIGLWNTVDHVSTRMAASFSPSIMNTSGFWYHFLQRTYPGLALTDLYWRISTYLSASHAHYGANEDMEKLRPRPYEHGMFWGSGGVGIASAPDFWKVLHAGDVTIRQGEVESFSHGNVVNLKDGHSFETDFVIMCTGYDKGYKAFTPELREQCGLYYNQNDKASRWANIDARADAIVDDRLPFLRNPPEPACGWESQPSHGPSRHYRRLIVPEMAANNDRSILFPGQIHSVFTPLTGEVQALWGAAYMLGYMDLPSQGEMELEAATFNAWTRKRYLEQGKKHAYFIYDYLSVSFPQPCMFQRVHT
jgi:dimethylaniline monooxygenase (N-oxide forming)